MIFNQFDETDIVAGRTTRVASGYWPDGLTAHSQSAFVDDFWSLTGSVGTPSYGTSVYDVRRTMYYLNAYPDGDYYNNNDPYFSVTYGNIYGNLGSGSFSLESASIQTSPTKTIYTQYKNMLLGNSDLDGMFTMQSGSTTVSAEDIWVVAFSAFKQKDKIDEGLIELSFSGSSGSVTLIDNSPYLSSTQNVYQLIAGTLDSLPSTPTYEGLGLFYPSNGVIILNAALLAARLGITDSVGVNAGSNGPAADGSWIYNPGLESTQSYTYNHKTLFESMKLANRTMNVRRSEFVPSRHYFIRIKNRDFNYSNNPTYVYDGTDNVHAKGTIRNTDFINDPKTYITTVGLYNDNNELVAVAKLSRPAVKSFDSELLIKVRLDF